MVVRGTEHRGGANPKAVDTVKKKYTTSEVHTHCTDAASDSTTGGGSGSAAVHQTHGTHSTGENSTNGTNGTQHTAEKQRT